MFSVMEPSRAQSWSKQIYTYIYTYVYICVHTYIYTYIYPHLDKYTSVQCRYTSAAELYAYQPIQPPNSCVISNSMGNYITCIYTCIYIYTHMYICI